MSKANQEVYTSLPPHTLNAEEQRYIAGLSKEMQELHELAVKLLGSSYFVKETREFRKWSSSAAGQKKT